MRSKLKIITLVFALLTIVLVPSCFAATVLEDTNEYAEGAIIYGSTRFDMDQIITAGVAFNAGINESKVWVAMGNKLNELEPVTPYYYDGATWYQITSESAEEVADENEIKKIEENLHIFFVNNEVKTVEVPFDGTVDEGSVTEGVKYDSEDKAFKVPAYVFDFEFTTGGAEIEVKTNVDTNIKEGNTEEEVKIPEIIDNNIASIGTAFYTDIYAAIEAAKEGETVKLLQDIELSKQIVVNKAVTLDLNGKTIKAAEDLSDISAILVLEGGDLVITGNGTLNAASQGNNYSIAVWAKETGKATIKNGTFTNVGAKSKTETGANNNEMIYVSGSGVITIEDGIFIGNTENEKWGTHYTLNAHDASYNAGTAKIIVKGGTYTTFDPANNEAEGKETNFVAEGYKSVKEGDTYKVLPYDANNVTEESELRALLQEGGTVKLGSDIKLETNKTIGLEKDVVLDLNGHTISVFEGYTKNNVIWTSAKLTVTGNGTIDARMTDSTYTYALYAWNGGNITIENGNFIGIYGLEDYVTALIYCQGEGSLITILDGTFVGDGVFTLNVSDAHYTAGTANIVVKGGTFTGFNPANNEAEGPNTNFVAEGYKTVKEGDKYKVVPYDSDNVTDEEELRTLVAEGKSVKLAADIELSKQLVVTKAITLDFNGKVVTVAEDLEDISAILVLEGGDLVITGNGTLNAASQGNNYSIAVWAKETGNVTIKNGTFTNVGAKSKTETGANNNEMIYVSGSGIITIEGGTFVGNTENETWGTRYTLNSHDTSYTAGTANIIVKGGTFTKFNPADNLAEGEGTNFVAEGYKVVVDGDKYTVVAE